MKHIRYIVISVLVLLVVLVSPVRTLATTNAVQLSFNLNVALCVNDWDRASNLVQQTLDTNLNGAVRLQLTTLYAQIQDYQARNVQVDQSEACEAAVAAGRGGGATFIGFSSSKPTCSSDLMAVDGRCLANSVAARRHSRSVEEGDRPNI